MRASHRRVIAVLLLIVCLAGTIGIVPGDAFASEEMLDCLDAGHELSFFLWSVYMCRILTICGGDYPW